MQKLFCQPHGRGRLAAPNDHGYATSRTGDREKAFRHTARVDN
jgi:hypothetical protein